MEGMLPLRTEPRGIVMSMKGRLILDWDCTFSRSCESEISIVILRHIMLILVFTICSVLQCWESECDSAKAVQIFQTHCPPPMSMLWTQHRSLKLDFHNWKSALSKPTLWSVIWVQESYFLTVQVEFADGTPIGWEPQLQKKTNFHHFGTKVMSDLSSWSTVSKEFALPPHGLLVIPCDGICLIFYSTLLRLTTSLIIFWHTRTRKCSASKWSPLSRIFFGVASSAPCVQDSGGQSANCGIELQVFEGKSAQAVIRFGCETCVWTCGNTCGMFVKVQHLNRIFSSCIAGVCVCVLYVLIPFVEQWQIQAHAHMGSNLEPGMRVVIASWDFTCYIMRFKQRLFKGWNARSSCAWGYCLDVSTLSAIPVSFLGVSHHWLYDFRVTVLHDGPQSWISCDGWICAQDVAWIQSDR